MSAFEKFLAAIVQKEELESAFTCADFAEHIRLFMLTLPAPIHEISFQIQRPDYDEFHLQLVNLSIKDASGQELFACRYPTYHGLPNWDKLPQYCLPIKEDLIPQLTQVIENISAWSNGETFPTPRQYTITRKGFVVMGLK